jgi:hypothetical protein
MYALYLFSFLMINPLFVQRTIRRGKLNKQIHRVKVSCAQGIAEQIDRKRFTNSGSVSIIIAHLINA